MRRGCRHLTLFKIHQSHPCDSGNKKWLRVHVNVFFTYGKNCKPLLHPWGANSFAQSCEYWSITVRTGRRALFVPLVPIVGPASSGCLGYCIPCGWSSCCCYANERISKPQAAAAACRVYVREFVRVCGLFTVWHLRGRWEARAFNLKCHTN